MSKQAVSEAVAKIRAVTVEKKADFPSDIVDIDGVPVEVKALTFGEKKDIRDGLTDVIVTDPKMSRAEALQEGAFDIDYDQHEYEIRLLLRCVFAPGTDKLVFTDADRDLFNEQPAHKGHWLQRLIEKATELNEAGNSPTTESD